MTHDAAIPCRPVAVVRNARHDASDTGWGEVVSRIELDAGRFRPSALQGLEDFSHVEIVFHFHLLPDERIETDTRHPRDNPAWPRLGIFAQRAAGRPNRLGVSRARVLGIDGAALVVQGLDAVDGTPVLDIKPWMRQFGPPGEVRQPAWCAEVMAGYFD